MGVKTQLAKKAIGIIAVVVIAVYFVVILSNFGGEVDRILKVQTERSVSQQLMQDPQFSALPPEKQEMLINKTVQSHIHARGLDQPFFQRSLNYWYHALNLDLGRAMFIKSAAGSSMVRNIILERLPRTVLLFTTATIIAAFLGIHVGLRLAKSALSKLDRFLTSFCVATYVIPPWVFGIIFILFFAISFRIFPSGGYLSAPPPESGPLRFLDILYHMSLPLITLVLSSFGYWAYISRNLFSDTMQSDFVMTGIAKGIPTRKLLRRHVLRPTLPPIFTLIILALIGSWTGAIITEIVFNWPGLGLLFWQALRVLDTPIIIGVVTIYAYLLGGTVLILDILYRYFDPRIRGL